jgi:autotransporter-associated beta strand protein
VVGTGGSYSSRDDLTALLPIHSIQFTNPGGVSLDAIAGLTLSLRARGMLQSSAGHNAFGIDLLLVDDPSGSPGDHTLQVDNSATQLDMVRGIAGSASENLVKSGTGTLTLNGVNKTYAGATLIIAGQVTLTGPGAIPSSSAVSVNAGTLNLNDFSQMIGSLDGGGSVLLGRATLTTGLNNQMASFGGIIGGPGGVSKSGSATQKFTGNNTYTGLTRISSGTLLINGAQAGSNVDVAAGAVLGGRGTVGNIGGFGAVRPGDEATGILHATSAGLSSGSSFRFRLNGPAPGTGYDQLLTTGNIDLTMQPTLDVSLNYSPASFDNFVLLQTTGGTITGMFQGLPNRTPLTLGGRTYYIVYQPQSVLLVPPCTAAILDGILTVNCTGGPNTITVDHQSNAALINGQSFPDSMYNSIQINGGVGGLTTNILANVKPLSVFGASSADVTNVGNAGTLASINSDVSVFNRVGSATLNVNDQADPNSRMVAISGSGITGLSAGAINTGASAIGNLTVNGGTGGNTYFISATPASAGVTLNTRSGTSTTNVQGNTAPLTINASSDKNNVINVSSDARTLDPIGSVTLTGSAMLSVDDSGFTDIEHYTLAADTLTIDRSSRFALYKGGLVSPITDLFVLPSGAVFDIVSTSGSVSIYGQGDNTFRVGGKPDESGPQNLDAIGGLVAIHSPSGAIDFFDDMHMPPGSRGYHFDCTLIPGSLTLDSASTHIAEFDDGSGGAYGGHIYLLTDNHQMQHVTDSCGVTVDPSTPPPAPPSGGPSSNELPAMALLGASAFGIPKPTSISSIAVSAPPTSGGEATRSLKQLAMDALFGQQDQRKGMRWITAYLIAHEDWSLSKGLSVISRNSLEGGRDFRPELLPPFPLLSG